MNFNENKKYKISVIVPCYNVEKYINDCLKSLINQTFKDFEIICVNDGSKDKTLELLQKYSNNENIKIINQENQGLSGARNTGVKYSNSEYLTFIDSDDWVNSEYLEKLYNSITKNNCDIAVSSMIRKRPKSEKYRLYYKEEKIYSNLQEKLDICKIPKCCYVCGKLFKKELIENKPFKKGVYFEDVIWTPYILKEAKNIVVVPDSYYFYRVNNSSIVKGVQSVKKQFDSYCAKSGIVEFYKKNNLKLSEKSKNVTKYISYFLDIPILKVKEYENIETSYLFGFLPIAAKKATPYFKLNKIKKLFLFKELDSHIYLNIFGIHLGFKINKKFKNKKVNSNILKNNGTSKLIVSLTTYPDRINYVHKTIDTILNQTLRADKIILWLAESQFLKKEQDLPSELLNLREQGLEIRWCEDLKSYKKLVPAVKEFPDDIIVTADDDLYYPNDWLENLYNAYLKDPKNIYTRRAVGVKLKGHKLKITPHYINNSFKPSYINQLMGGAGTLYPPHSLHKDILNIDKIKLIPTYDDIYFWTMAILNGTKIGIIEKGDLNLYNVENTQNSALCKINNAKENNMSDIEAYNIMIKEYGEIINILQKES